MVISYVRRFLFVHVYKAAGMSIEKALKAYDTRSGLSTYPAEEQRRLLGELGFSSAILDMQRHVFAREILETLGPDMFGRLFKFAFVRNPWDLQLSLYHFNIAHPEFANTRKPVNTESFEAHILGLEPAPHPVGQQRQFLIDRDGRVLVDFIGRFERIGEDFATVCRRIGLESCALEHINRTDHAPWQKSYTRRMFEIVRDIHRIDIDAFGYADEPAAYGIA